MSSCDFTSPSATASVSGREWHRLRRVLHQMATGVLDARSSAGQDRLEELSGTRAPAWSRSPADGPAFYAALQQWATGVEYRVTNHGAEDLSWRGVPLKKLGLVCNTAMVLGSDPVRLAGRLIAQADGGGCWAEGPDRAWLAGIIRGGLESGALASREIAQLDEGARWFPTGWEDVAALLESRDDEPVVMTYSVSGGFPGGPPAGWRTELAGSDDREDQWWAAPAAERWAAGLEWLRAWQPGARLTPATWASVRFDHGLSVLDLMADDWIERLNDAITQTRSPK
jgi:hypothetical protein